MAACTYADRMQGQQPRQDIWSPALSSSAAPSSPSMIAEDLDDTELAVLEAEESQRAETLRQQVLELQAKARHHEARRRRLAREVIRRRFAASAFGRVNAEAVLQFLNAAEALRWAAASLAARAQVCMARELCSGSKQFVASEDAEKDDTATALLRWRRPVAHLRGVAADMPKAAARALAAGLRWASLQTLVIDVASPGWQRLLEALVDAAGDAVPPSMPQLSGLSISCPPERLASTRQMWQAAAPLLLRLVTFARTAPLQELVLDDLRSTELLETVFRQSGATLRVCRASFIGPESRHRPVELPSTGLPVLRCLLLRHRDFCEQRASRRERMTVSAKGLLDCLNNIREPGNLNVLALAGIRIDGNRVETAALFRALPAFSGLIAIALRFSVPSTFGELLPAKALFMLRCSWPRLSYFKFGEMSLHGFDYWPEQITDFNQLYSKGQIPPADEVFHNEFRYVLSTQYGTTADRQWEMLDGGLRQFWVEVARRLPSMPHSELRRRAAELFPSGL